MNHLSRLLVTSAALLLGSCAPATNIANDGPPPPPSQPAPPSTALPGGCVCGTEPGCPPCPVPSGLATASSVPAAPPGAGTFPPASFAAPVERTKKSGDGEWTPMTVHKGSGKDSPLYTTLVHPHGIRGFVVVQLVAIDTTRVSMDMILGTDEPEGTSFPKDKRPGLVPADAFDSLIAVTNGGFKKRHGNHGVGAFGEVVLNPTAEYCTFAKHKDGHYLIGTYSKISPEFSAGFQWFRQTPPCLIEDGVLHPNLSDEYKAKKWGGAEDGNKEIRRSAIGFGDDPRVLYFAIGDYLTAEWLAQGLKAAGIKRAAELDINYSYTRFIVYERAGSELVATSPLLQELKHPRKEYIKEPSQRDFFTLRWKK